MNPRSKKGIRPSRRLLLLLAVGAVLLAAVWTMKTPELADLPFVSPTKNGSQTQSPEVEPFDKTQHSLNDPASLWVVVNKGRKLPSSYVPADLTTPAVRIRSGNEAKLRAEAARALEQMFSAAKDQGLTLMVTSAYRSYSYQQGLYSNYLKTQGQAYTDATSARPGHSEHQTGLAVDISPGSRKCELDTCFADTSEGVWTASNAHKYGFIIRYPQNKQPLTGYSFEPWHLRYVGTELAQQITSGDKTLEQFFEMTIFPAYPSKIYQLTETN